MYYTYQSGLCHWIVNMWFVYASQLFGTTILYITILGHINVTVCLKAPAHVFNVQMKHILFKLKET